MVPIHLPPLRERGDDVILLAEYFTASAAAEYDVHGLALTAQLRDAIRRHTWPGNVRELRNSVERAVLLGDGQLTEADFFPPSPARVSTSELPFPATLDEIDRAAAAAMVERFGGNKSGAAAALGISRSRLYRLLDPRTS